MHHFILTLNIEYTKLRETIPIIGVWDDHDYGKDNSNKHYKNKNLTKPLYLDFI